MHLFAALVAFASVAVAFQTAPPEINPTVNKLTAEFGRKGIKAVVIAPGSTGDVLPLLHFAANMNRKLPFLDITRFAAYEPTKVDGMIREQGMEYCPYMKEIINQRTWKTVLESSIQPSAVKMLSKFLNPKTGMLNQKNFAAETMRMNIVKMLGDAQVVFFWDMQPLAIDPSTWCQNAMKNRILIKISPTYVLR